MKLTSNPADFDEVMFALASLLADTLHDNSVIEAIVEDVFVQVCPCLDSRLLLNFDHVTLEFREGCIRISSN